MLPIHAILNPNGKHVNEQYKPQVRPGGEIGG